MVGLGSWGRARLLGAVVLLVVSGCGDGDRNIGTGVRPQAGLFQGMTGQGGSITIEVGSIERLVLECDGEEYTQVFSPPARVTDGGFFGVTIRDRDRRFDVEGFFDTNDTVDGTIDDHDDVCDMTFSADRRGTRTASPTTTPTPTVTVEITPGPGTPTATVEEATPSPTPTSTAVVNPGTPTVTFTPSPGPGTPTVTRTATPTATATGTATATATATPSPVATPICGNGVLEAGEVCDSGMSFGLDGAFGCRVGAQCGCCYCRPLDGAATNSHLRDDVPCTACHLSGATEMPGIGAKPPKPGANATFTNGVCN
jgi:hypothetical protein